jgi:transcriptional regulator with XRE-family HTH domain
MIDEVSSDSDELHVALGKRIRQKRLSSGLTQAQLAERIAISRTSLTNMELGRQRLLVDQLYKVAEVLNTLPRDLLPGPTEMVAAAAANNDAREAIPESVHRFAQKLHQRKHK